MQSSESCTECHMLLLTETMNSLETINLGSITVHWSRSVYNINIIYISVTVEIE